MSEPVADPRGLDPAAARRLLGGLSLGAGERVLCLGPAGGAVASRAASLVGPDGQVAEADPGAAAGAALPYVDGEFDAVVVDLTAPADPALRPEPAGLLAEVARVTAPTGRIAFAAVPPADGEPLPVLRLATDTGLRGVTVRPDPGTGTGGAPVEFVTAFPPVPAGSTDDAPTAELHLPEPAGPPGRRRLVLVAAATAALVLAAAAGVGWGLAGPEPGAEAPGGGSGLAAGDPELDVDQPGVDGQPAADDPPAGGGLPAGGSGSGPGSDSGSGPGSGSGSSGGGGPENQPPVIEDLSLSSDGLSLRIETVVSDPDGDEVSLAIEVDGVLRTIHDGNKAFAAFSYSDVGEEHEASVTVTATDPDGASAWQTASHLLVAKTTVTVRNVTFRILSTASCFDAAPAHRIVGRLTLSGVVGGSRPFDEELRRDRPELVLFDSSTRDSTTSEQQRLTLEFAFNGQSDTYQKVHRASDQVARVLTRGDCSGWLFYEVVFERT